MKNLILIITCFTLSLSCKAQQIVPLNTYTNSIQNNDYLKDLNNELDFFIGTYQTHYQGNTYTLYITKIIKKPFFDGVSTNYFQDVLSMRYTIKNSSGQTIEDTQNMTFAPNQDDFTIYSIGNWDSNKIVVFFYQGIGCAIGSGRIIFKHISGNQFSFKYKPGEYPYPFNCPNLTENDVKLPAVVDDIIFTKL